MQLPKAKGEMYDFVTHNLTHLAGKCSHCCPYCYVTEMGEFFPNVRKKYSGEIRIAPGTLGVNYGTGNTIFVEHLNDLFAKPVPEDFIVQILGHSFEYPDNDYLFQTRNPVRCFEFLPLLPAGCFLGTTIETNNFGIGDAPPPAHRAKAMSLLPPSFRKFVTVEPILKFNLASMVNLILESGAEFVNIGADSKGCDLEEPTYSEVVALADALSELGIEVRTKRNMERLARTNAEK